MTSVVRGTLELSLAYINIFSTMQSLSGFVYIVVSMEIVAYPGMFPRHAFTHLGLDLFTASKTCYTIVHYQFRQSR